MKKKQINLYIAEMKSIKRNLGKNLINSKLKMIFQKKKTQINTIIFSKNKMLIIKLKHPAYKSMQREI